MLLHHEVGRGAESGKMERGRAPGQGLVPAGGNLDGRSRQRPPSRSSERGHSPRYQTGKHPRKFLENPVIVDFGAARLAAARIYPPGSDAFIGTLRYMAPELLVDNRNATTASDIYALGAVMYELLTGQDLFNAEDEDKLMAKILGGRFRRPRELNTSVDGFLESICLCCLQSEPEKRYSSAAAMEADLQTWLSGKVLFGVARKRIPPIIAWAEGHPWFLAAGLSFIITGLLLSFMLLRGLFSPHPVESDGVSQFVSIADQADTTRPSIPRIEAIKPSAGASGSLVTIVGGNFSVARSNQVYFPGGIRSEVVSATSTSIVARVPRGARLGPILANVGGRIASSPVPFVPVPKISAGGRAPLFDEPVRWPLPIRAGWLIIEDLDGDGRLDVCAMSYEMENTLCLFHNQSSPGKISLASLVRRNVLDSGHFVANHGGAADLNGDGKPDLVLPTISGQARLLLNRGDGKNIDAKSFGPPQYFFAPGSQVIIKDFDSDGRMDLLLYGNSGKSILLYRNHSERASFSAAKFSLAFKRVTGVIAMACSEDLDGDGRPDLLTSLDDAVTLHRNVCAPGVITSESFALPESKRVCPDINSLAAFDLDGDTVPDIVAGSYSAGAFYVLKGARAPQPSLDRMFPAAVSFPCGFRSCRSGFGDLTGDARPDMVIPIEDDGILEVRVNRSAPGKIDFAPPIILRTGGQPLIAAIADLDADGLPDVIAAGFDGALTVFRGRNDE